MIAQRPASTGFTWLRCCLLLLFRLCTAVNTLVQCAAETLKGGKRMGFVFGGQLCNFGQRSSGKHHYLCMSDLAGCCLSLFMEKGSRTLSVARGFFFFSFFFLCLSQDESLKMENLKVENVSVGQDGFFIAIQRFYNMARRLREMVFWCFTWLWLLQGLLYDIIKKIYHT